MNSRKVQLHTRTTAKTTVYSNCSPALLSESVSLAKTKTGTFVERLGGEERFEKSRQMLWVNAHTRVFDLKTYEFAVQLLHLISKFNRFRCYAYLTMICDSVTCVENQIKKYHLKL